MTTVPTTAQPAFLDTSRANYLPCLVVDEHEVITTVPLVHLLGLVPDPRQFEDKKFHVVIESDPMLADLAEERVTVQRYFTGAKKTNLPKYAEFITKRVLDSEHRGTPTLCLGITQELEIIPAQNGVSMVAIPYGKKFIAVDGETQRAAWQLVYEEVYRRVKAGMAKETVLQDIRVPVEIHHGVSVARLQALFYERNVLGAKVNANEAIAKDVRDPATRLCRLVMDRPITLPNGQEEPLSSLVQEQSRQVGKKSKHWVTLSSLRTLVVTTVLGRAGLQYGAKPISLPEGIDFDALATEVVPMVYAILQKFAGAFADKENMLIGAPSIMAGIGIAANRAVASLPNTSGRPRITVNELMEMLAGIRWDKEGEYWAGIATRKTPKGGTTVAGPKEVGYAVADAIDGTNPETAAQVRGQIRPLSPGEQWKAPEPLA